MHARLCNYEIAFGKSKWKERYRLLARRRLISIQPEETYLRREQ